MNKWKRTTWKWFFFSLCFLTRCYNDNRIINKIPSKKFIINLPTIECARVKQTNKVLKFSNIFFNEIYSPSKPLNNFHTWPFLNIRQAKKMQQLHMYVKCHQFFISLIAKKSNNVAFWAPLPPQKRTATWNYSSLFSKMLYY